MEDLNPDSDNKPDQNTDSPTFFKPSKKKFGLICLLIFVASFVLWQFIDKPPQPKAASNRVSLDGQLVITHGDDFIHHKEAVYYQLDTTSGKFNLHFKEAEPELPRATKVHINGNQSGQTIEVDAAAAGGVTPATDSTAAAAVTSGSKKVLVLMVNFSNDTSQPYTASYANGIMFSNPDSVAAYYKEVSWGSMTVTGDVKGWYTIAANNSSSCDPGTWASQADQAATAAGVNLSAYDYHMYALSSNPACWWSGWAYIPGSQSWVGDGTYGMGPYIAKHELGHNFGTHHASTYNCSENGVRVSLSATLTNCSTDEYGDPNSVMGNSSTHHQTNFALGNYGLLSQANSLDISQSGTYTLKPIEPFNPSGVQAMRVVRSTTGYWAANYFLFELREPFGTYFDNYASTDPAVNGVLVRVVPDYNNLSQSWLVDSTPATNDFSDAALAVGQSVYDPLRDVTFTLQSLSTNGANIKVTFGPKADTTPPSPASALKFTVQKKNFVTLKWTASKDSSVAGYRIYRNGAYLTSVANTTTTFTNATVPSGTYSYYVVAFDASLNFSSPTNTVQVKI